MQCNRTGCRSEIDLISRLLYKSGLTTIRLNYPVSIALDSRIKCILLACATFPANAHVRCNPSTEKKLKHSFCESDGIFSRERKRKKKTNYAHGAYFATKFKYSMHMVSSARIFHFGCLLEWNTAYMSWDAINTYAVQSLYDDVGYINANQAGSHFREHRNACNIIMHCEQLDSVLHIARQPQ